MDGLSLTGSQIGTPQSSARKPQSRPSSASGARAKTPASPERRGSASPGRQKQTRNDPRATSSNAARDSSRNTGRDDFLSLFESSAAPKIKKPQQQVKEQKSKSKPAWATPGHSARSDADSFHSGARGASSSATGTADAHSVFTPATARTDSSTEEHQDEFSALITRISQAELDTGLLTPASSSRNGSTRGARASESNDHKMSPRAAAIDQVVNTLHGRERHQSHGENDLSLTSNDVIADKATKLNSIANNMTSQAKKKRNAPQGRTPLEHSLQNIRHKTPVNQVKGQSSVASGGMGVNQKSGFTTNTGASMGASTGAGATRACSQASLLSLSRQGSRTSNPDNALDIAKRRNMAATRIQRCYRRNMKRRRSGEAALRRMLESKKKEREALLNRSAVFDAVGEEESKEAARKKVREEKARQARQEAIKELQRKREEKREEHTRDEIKFLRPSGKVAATPKRAGQSQANKDKKRTEKSSKAQPQTQDSTSPGRGAGPSTSRSALTNGRLSDAAEYEERSTARDITARESSADVTQTSARQLASHRAEQTGGEASEVGSQPATTLEDLMSTLSKLEEDASFVPASNTKPLHWLDALEQNTERKNEVYLSTDNLQRIDKLRHGGEGGAGGGADREGVLSDEKLRNIMSYLDEVETAERLSSIDQDLTRVNATLELPAPLVPSSGELAELEAASASAAQVTDTVLKQKMELEEKKRSLSLLQKALKQQRELTVRHALETEREMKKRLDVQKDEYEDTIKRHLAFIDQLIDDKKELSEECEELLIDDKKALSEKCEGLVKEFKTVDKKYSDKLRNVNDQHEQELRKLREVQAAAEKLRREKWIDEKTKKIKEMTVKGLEPEIQRLIAKHSAEIKKLKSLHEAELLASDERAGGKYVRMTEELRDQLAREKEQACARERELARQTYEKQLASEEEAFQQQRRRLYAEVHEEKERLAQQASRQRTELDRLQRQLEEQTTHATEAMRGEYEKARDEQNLRHESELRQLKDQLALEKAAWEENYKKKQDTWAIQKERELREAVRKERDQEIELVIRRLEEDSQSAREESQRLADNRVTRIRDKYEAEMSELERSERLTTEKYNQTKARLAEVEGEGERMKVTLKQKDKEIEELKKLLDKLNEERSHVSDVIRQEFADRLVATEEENKRIKNDMFQLKARHKIELERVRGEIEVVQRAKQEEMDEVHKRVRQAIVKKEEVMTQLREQYQAAVKRADHLEGLLEQQRKQLLGK